MKAARILLVGRELLWGKKMQFDNGIGNMFALGLLSSMFGNGFGSSSLTNNLAKTIEAKEVEEGVSE